MEETILKEESKFKENEIILNPFLGEAKSGDLAGIRSCDIFHKGTRYELAYRLEETDKGNVIVVIMAGMRETFYKQLKRHMK